MIDSKLALVFEGPGFSEQTEIVEKLKLQGYNVQKREIGYGEGYADCPELLTAGLIVMRGPWALSFEDRLMASLLALRLSKSWDTVKSRGGLDQKQTLLAIGRGALLALNLLDPKGWELTQWTEALRNVGPWIPTKVIKKEIVINGLVQGRGLPKISEQLAGGLQPWLKVQDDVVGWKSRASGSGMYFSLVDILGYSDRTQMVNYGYEDLTHIPTQDEVLVTLLQRGL